MTYFALEVITNLASELSQACECRCETVQCLATDIYPLLILTLNCFKLITFKHFHSGMEGLLMVIISTRTLR